MNRTLRDIMNNDLLFGKIIMLYDDFRLFLPIKIYGTRSEIVKLLMKFMVVLDIGDGILNDSNDLIFGLLYCIQ